MPRNNVAREAATQVRIAGRLRTDGADPAPQVFRYPLDEMREIQISVSVQPRAQRVRRDNTTQGPRPK